MRDYVLGWSAAGRWGGLVLWHVLVALLRVSVLRVRCCFACAVRFARFWVFVCGGSLAEWSGFGCLWVNPGK